MREWNSDEWNILGMSGKFAEIGELMALAIKVKGIGQSYLPSYARKCRFTFHVRVEFPSVPDH